MVGVLRIVHYDYKFDRIAGDGIVLEATNHVSNPGPFIVNGHDDDGAKLVGGRREFVGFGDVDGVIAAVAVNVLGDVDGECLRA